MTEDKANYRYRQLEEKNSQPNDNYHTPFSGYDRSSSPVAQPDQIKTNSSLGNTASSSVNAATQTAQQNANAAKSKPTPSKGDGDKP